MNVSFLLNRQNVVLEPSIYYKLCELTPIVMVYPQPNETKKRISFGNKYGGGVAAAHKENSWKINMRSRDPNKENDRKVLSLLNKISSTNYKKILAEIKKIELNVGIIDLIFKKIVAEPFYINLYINLCNDLDINDILNEKWEEEFKIHKHKNLTKFMSKLYLNGVVNDIKPLFEILTKDLNEENLEILVLFIKEIGKDREEFADNIKYLVSIKDTFKPRFKFMIMDIM